LKKSSEEHNSGLIGKNGVIPLYPLCKDSLIKSKDKSTICCSVEENAKGNCNIVIESSPIYSTPNSLSKIYNKLSKINDEKYNVINEQLPNMTKTDIVIGEVILNKDKHVKSNKYSYNTNLPFARKNQKKTSNAYQFISKLLPDDSSIRDLDKLEYVRIPTSSVGDGTIDFQKNNENNMKQYVNDILYGKNKQPGKECNFSSPENCDSLGSGYWTKIGTCPDDPNKPMYAWIDVTNKNSSLNKEFEDSKYLKPFSKGLTSNIIKDLYRFNPVATDAKLAKAFMWPGSCSSHVNIPNKPNKGFYIPFMGDTLKEDE